jgi:uncharacterized protein
MNDKLKQEIQSAVFDKLISHLRYKNDLQNIDLMNLAGFCRNCLSKWYLEEANSRGIKISYSDAKEQIYGMPYLKWKERYQK